MEKIKLNDSTEFEIESGATENSISMAVESLEDMIPRINALTEDNLSEYEILNDAGLVTAILSNKYVVSFTGRPVEGTQNYIITFKLADVDVVSKRLTALEETQSLQDSAIEDIATVVSEIAESEVTE